MHTTRPAAVSGSYYPEEASRLRALVEHFVRAQEHDGASADALQKPPAALIVPHDAYRYSGAIAGHAYRRLIPWRKAIHRVVLLGPAHHSDLRGVALSAAGYFRTPLGDVVLDSHEILSLQNFPGFEFQDQAHAREHTLEVQLPFLQTVLDDFHLIPVLAGDATPQVLRPMLERYWATAHTLIVLSTNLSHHLDDISARKLDTQTCKAIEAMDEAHIGEAQACGRYPLRALLRVARHHHARVHTLAMGTSADHGGDRQRVTGFGAWSIEL